MPTYSDRDAVFRASLACDIGEVEPMVAAPPSCADPRPLAEVLGLPLDVGYLGSCASGRLEDLRLAARILSGGHIAPGFRLDIVPSSLSVLEAARSEGTLDTLLAAGATIGQSSCNFCYGASGALVAGQRSVSSGTLNIPGRMGSAAAEVWLASPAVVAASALAGRLADPRGLLS
jgi:3-isopropylmalate/(R)-2-methylmalate dehydratase large subunit